MYKLLEVVGDFVKSLLNILVGELCEMRIYDSADALRAMSRIAVRVGEEKAKLDEALTDAFNRIQVAHEQSFIDRVCFSESWGEQIKVGETSTFKLKKNYAVLLGCDDWDYPEERDEYDSISPEQYEIGAAMRERMRVITGTGYGEFERARRFFAFEGKIAFIKLVRELTMDLVGEDGVGKVGLKKAKEFTEDAHEETKQDVLVFKADLRRLLEKHIVN